MRKYPVFVMVCAALILGVALIIIKSEWGMLLIEKLHLGQRGENRRVKNELVSHVWLGTQIAMTGLETHASNRFGSVLQLTFEKDGTCSLEIGEEVIRARWKIKGDKLWVQGGRIETDGDFRFAVDQKTLSSLTLHEIDSYSVIFSKKEDLDRLNREIAQYKEEENLRLAEWKSSLNVDLSTCEPDFVALLKSHDFQKFEPVRMEEGDKEALIQEYFAPLLSLGLPYTSWNWVYSQDGDRLLDGYERYELALQTEPKERAQRAGELVMVPYDEVECYIRPRIRLGQEPLRDLLEEMLKKSERYHYDTHSFAMKILKDPEPFEADLLEIWQHDRFGGQTVIHMLYGAGDRKEDHAWFLMEADPYAGCQTYLGGSAFEPEDGL